MLLIKIYTQIIHVYVYKVNYYLNYLTLTKYKLILIAFELSFYV